METALRTDPPRWQGEALAEAPSTPALFFAQARRLGPKTALREKRLGLWREITWAEYGETVRHLAYGLLDLGLQPGDRAAVIGENRPEWIYSDLAILSCGAVTVGLYPTDSAEACAYILEHAEAVLVVAENEEQLDKLLEVRHRLPALHWIIVVDRKGLRHFADPQVLWFDEVLARGRELAQAEPGRLDAIIAGIQPEDLAAIIYTSGTTGPPKGAMLTHRNLLWTANALNEANAVGEGDECFSFLPLSHIAQRMLSVYLAIRWGMTVSFVEYQDTVLQNLREIAPTVLFSVPRIWEKLHARVELLMHERDWFKRTAYRIALAVGRRHARARLLEGRVGPSLALANGLAHLLVLQPLKRRLGLHRVRLAISGAAPISPEVLWYFHGLGVPIREVYGQTEGSGPTTIHRGDRIRLGTVGEPLPGVEVRIADDGEILVRGPNVFMGYFKDPEATAQALAGGWLHSGDVGELDEDGFLRITDRKKDLFITAGGKNIAPQRVENLLKTSPYIHDAIAIGDGRRYITAMLVLDEENVVDYAQRRRIPFTTYTDLTQNPEIRRLIEEEVRRLNRHLSQPEQVKRFVILPKRLYHEEGEMTPTLKVKRRVIMEKYQHLLAELYPEG
ncbi:MAG: AMP-binding protein [Limnochorda sp.]|uniref:AMP-dependent synthetase/ligase n=1 Tax=Limnochorda TaxID=1676651 RepID=UPI001EBEB6B5|nr:AMP-binding protein [Limnochorda pilosa]MBO2518632.1 long-chain fatty acid--CoA ligase [Bacillota bacterium]